MRILASTFADGDDRKVLPAMRMLPYDRLMLIGHEGFERSRSFARLSVIEEASGHTIDTVVIPDGGFMELVDEISDALARRSKGNTIVLNISGGPKILGDAALFAAFRHGIEAYHCEDRLVKLPVLRGVTAKDMFTRTQKAFILKLDGGLDTLDEIAKALGLDSRQPAERVLRDLRRAGIVTARVASGRIKVSLTDRGAEIVKVLRLTEQSE